VSTGLDKVVPLRYGDSSKLRPGDIVLAIGNPLGVGQTATMGIISATGRANVGIAEYEDFLQTDAAINPGNSGGALINTRGEVIGINTAMLSRSGGNQGIGFAIPSNMVQEIAESLLAHGEVARGWLGIVIQTLDSDLAKAMNLPVEEGVVISDIAPDGPAERAGLERGDVLVEINGKAVKNSGRVRNLVASAGAGAPIELQVIHKGKRKKLIVKLAAMPTEKADAKVKESTALAGMTLGRLTDEARRKYEIPASVTRGLVVTAVEMGGVAADAGIRVGDIILEVDGTPIDSVRPFRKRYEASKSRVLLLINRGGTTIFVAIRK
jgi:serine protease Do